MCKAISLRAIHVDSCPTVSAEAFCWLIEALSRTFQAVAAAEGGVGNRSSRMQVANCLGNSIHFIVLARPAFKTTTVLPAAPAAGSHS